MWHCKLQVILPVASTSLVTKNLARGTTRKSKASMRCLSSSNPHVYHGQEADEHVADIFTRKQEALQKMLTETTAIIKVDVGRRDPPISSDKELHPLQVQERHKSPSELTYTGGATMPVTSDLHIVTPDEDTPRGIWPVFRIMDEDGNFRDGQSDAFRFDLRTPDKNVESTKSRVGTNSALDILRKELKESCPRYSYTIDNASLLAPSANEYPDMESNDTLLRAYTHMVRLREMDKILQNAQRQGRISFYMTCHGEEAIHVGAASALELRDTILAQYREAGVLMWRGFTLQQFADQCFSNKADLGKGRQMPVHYGSRALNYQTISSPLGTQIPQAAGAAYRLKLARKDAVACCFFGDGCASTTDFHAGLNFAATLGAPVVFFCRNNGYAISTPVTDQYVGDGIVSRAPGYGMAAIRVDGNDVFAVHEAVREARAYALRNSAPVLIEAMTYRQGHHSTSDDSLRYRSAKEIQGFTDRGDPLSRFQKFMARNGQLDSADFAQIEKREKAAVILAMREAEGKPMPPLDDLFEDVYCEMPYSLKEQKQQLHEHLQKYPKEYQ